MEPTPGTLTNYLREVHQEIRLRTETENLLFPEAATRYLTELLADIDLTSDVVYCVEDHSQGRGKDAAYRITGFSLLDNSDHEEQTARARKSRAKSGETTTEAENLDLFIFGQDEDQDPAAGPQTLNTADLNQLAKLATNFLARGLRGYLKTELDSSSLAFELANKLAHEESRPIRVRIFILTTKVLGDRVQALAEQTNDQGVVIQYLIWDLKQFHQVAAGGFARQSIEIDFEKDEGLDGPLPCLPMPVENQDYQSYLAIIPGKVLAKIYLDHGSRLLEQNVRSFLQFGGKTNRGIRDTIRDAPHRFLAYNNGLAATATRVTLTDLPRGGRALASIQNLQIVNGGQTTAAIFQSCYKTKANLDKVFVQLKLTVLHNPDDMSSIVPLISRYANTQNAISSADLSANSEFNMTLQRIARTTPGPALPGMLGLQYWYFERARGDYKNELARRFTPKAQKQFTDTNDKKRLLTKEAVAKYDLTWEGHPYIVARGAQKLYEFFTRTREKLPKAEQLPDQVWFQNMVAQAIMFQRAERLYDELYGRGGGYRALAVCYAVSWLVYLTNDRPLNRARIWRQQGLSEQLTAALKESVRAANEFLIATAGTRTPREWAVKQECWDALKVSRTPAPLLAAAIRALPDADRAIETAAQPRTEQETERALLQYRQDALSDLGPAAWRMMATWGRTIDPLNGKPFLTSRQSEMCDTIARRIETRRSLELSEVANGEDVIEVVLATRPDLLADLGEDPASPPAGTGENETPVTLADVDELLAWDRATRPHRLVPQEVAGLIRLQKLQQPFNENWQSKVRDYIARAEHYGFRSQELAS